MVGTFIPAQEAAAYLAGGRIDRGAWAARASRTTWRQGGGDQITRAMVNGTARAPDRRELGGTGIHRHAHDARPRRDVRRLGAWSPAARPPRADMIADAIAWLASPIPRFITGQTLFVDGGRSRWAGWASRGWDDPPHAAGDWPADPRTDPRTDHAPATPHAAATAGDLPPRRLRDAGAAGDARDGCGRTALLARTPTRWRRRGC